MKGGTKTWNPRTPHIPPSLGGSGVTSVPYRSVEEGIRMEDQGQHFLMVPIGASCLN